MIAQIIIWNNLLLTHNVIRIVLYCAGIIKSKHCIKVYEKEHPKFWHSSY